MRPCRVPASSILKAERTALNFLQRLSGIATETRRYVQTVSGHNCRIIDTRKTTPGFRTLQKYAIRAGGGFNHRRNLGDGILIKDNHIQALRGQGLSLGDIVKKAHANASHTIKVEVEVENLDEVKEALDAGAEILLLDNMGLKEMAQAVDMARGRAVTEASGGINLDTLKAVAETGVDLISSGRTDAFVQGFGYQPRFDRVEGIRQIGMEIEAAYPRHTLADGCGKGGNPHGNF